ncbi:MAG: extracellular solute-binding protein [bacterium]|nr:extracellular solute-binding protein [bacterium]
MKKNKIYFSLAIFSLSVFLVVSGFGCKGLSTTQIQATKTITLEYWTVFDDVDALRAGVDSFRQLRPYINVNIRQLRSDELYPRLVEALAEDKGPDIISVRNRWMKTYVSKLASMPASVDDTTIVVTKGQFGTNTTVNTATKPMINQLGLDREYIKVVKDDVVLNGNIYGLPVSLDTMAIFYNKDLLDSAGVAEPPKNWEEFQVAVKKMTKYDKKNNKILQSGAAFGAGANVPGSDDLLYLLFKQSGYNFTTKNGQAIFNLTPSGLSGGQEPPGISIMNFYTDYANEARDTYTWNKNMGNALDRFVNGSVGFFFGYSYNLPVIKARAPQLNLGVLPVFQLNPDKPVNVANYWVQTVVGKSKNQNESWNLIDYLTHSKYTKEYLDKTGRPTALRTFVTAQKENPDLDPFVSQILISENWYRGANYEAATKAINDLIDEWLTPAPAGKEGNWQQEMLNRAAAKINQTL